MHTLQFIAVKIDNKPEPDLVSLDECKKEAFDSVLNTFESWYSESEGLGGWSDWFVVGGGRWNSDPDNQYKEAYNDVISYTENAELFMASLERMMNNRKVAFSDYMKDIDFNGIQEKLIAYDGEMDFGFALYPLGKAIDMMNGKWDYNSYFYDITNYTTNTKYLLRDLDTDEKQYWYLVPVDFHF